MKNKTVNEVLEFVCELFPDSECSAEKSTQGVWTIEAKRMYEYPEFGAELLFKLCEFFDTMNINDSRYAMGGCETCDYGSSYELTLYVADGKPYPVQS